MKYLKLIVLAFVAIVINISCDNETKKENKESVVAKSEKVEVYYFHYTRRCETCNAVESVSKEAVEEYYGEKVAFADFNLDEEAGEAKGKELDVAGQTLLIVSGSKIINITNEGFLNAVSNPQKLKSLIKEKIDPLL